MIYLYITWLSNFFHNYLKTQVSYDAYRILLRFRYIYDAYLHRDIDGGD